MYAFQAYVTNVMYKTTMVEIQYVSTLKERIRNRFLISLKLDRNLWSVCFSEYNYIPIFGSRQLPFPKYFNIKFNSLEFILEFRVLKKHSCFICFPQNFQPKISLKSIWTASEPFLSEFLYAYKITKLLYRA